MPPRMSDQGNPPCIRETPQIPAGPPVAPFVLLPSVTGRPRAAELGQEAHLMMGATAAKLDAFETGPNPPGASPQLGVIEIPIAHDGDVVTARRAGRLLAIRAGFSSADSTIVATAISELAGNILLYAE